MSVVIARDRSAADHLIYKWPNPVPLGAQIECGGNDTVVMCTHGVVGAQFGSGAHTLNPPPHTLAYFVRIAPMAIPFDHAVSATVPSGHTLRIRVWGAVTVRVGDPAMLCMQVVPLPSPNIAVGVVRSIVRSVARVTSRVLRRRCTNGEPLSVGAILDDTASHHPLGGAVSGLEFLGFQEMNVSVDGGDPQSWNASTPMGIASPFAQHDSQQGLGHPGMSNPGMSNPGMSNPGMSNPQMGAAPPPNTGAFRTTLQGPATGAFDLNQPPPAPVDASQPPRRKTPPMGIALQPPMAPAGPMHTPPAGSMEMRSSGSSAVVSGEVITGEIRSGTIESRHSDSSPSLQPPPQPHNPMIDSNPSLQPPPQHHSPQHNPMIDSNPSLQPPPQVAPGYRPLPMGANVLVAWHDGLWHSATIRQFRDGQYEITLGTDGSVAWVAADQVRVT